jgi:hypothetical protein
MCLPSGSQHVSDETSAENHQHAKASEDATSDLHVAYPRKQVGLRGCIEARGGRHGGLSSCHRGFGDVGGICEG